MENVKNISLEILKDAKDVAINFKQLQNDIASEIELYPPEEYSIEDLNNQPIMLQLSDANGKTIFGYCSIFVGWLENGGILLAGNISEVIE